MVLIGLGANLGDPKAACLGAIAALDKHPNIQVVQKSRWYKTAPVPVSDQPWYVNGALQVKTSLSAHELLRFLHQIEADFGRIRLERNEARVLDLDLLAYGDQISNSSELLLPHPRISERAFVLIPLNDVAPNWRHPVSGQTVKQMLQGLPGDPKIELLDD